MPFKKEGVEIVGWHNLRRPTLAWMRGYRPCGPALSACAQRGRLRALLASSGLGEAAAFAETRQEATA